MRNIIKSENGSALLIAIIVILLVSVTAVYSVRRSTTDMTISHNQVHEEQAFYLAEAGAKKAFSDLYQDRTWRIGYDKETFGSGSFSVHLVDSVTTPALHDTMLIVSTGEVLLGASTVEMSTTPLMENIFKFAMFADKGIVFDRNTCTDSWDSDSGSYATTQADTMGDIGSNGTITTAKDVTVGGDISVATNGGINLGENNVVTGDTTSTADSVDIDIVPQWEYDWAEDVSSAPGGLSGTNYSYNNGTNALTSGQDANIVLQSGVYFFSSILLGKNSTLSLAPGAKVKIYLTGDITFNQFSKINDGGAPANLMVYSQGNLNFNQDNSFYGTFFGPNAHIQYDQTTEVYGAIVGSTIKLDQGACFHYDRSLARLQRPAKNGVVLVAWREVD